ncbi:SpvB/TcaC N-terminal domain-containing protein [Croceimicrobium sp.]|uniref:SpvB/TcaC N-terminal domain-containing protein n=1 Tax=Croceimicrobium sp. TaxID=2828340 RepID=UPI003BABE9C7
MKTDRISQVASCLLVFFFLFNDLHASARALSHWGEVQPISPTLNKSGHITKESRSLSKANSGTRRNTPIHQAQPVQENELLDLSEVQSFAVPAMEDEALIGMELNMPLNDPQDDIFNFQLPKNFKSADWSSVYLTYEVNGVEDGRSLAKSFNSNETFGERSLVKDDRWHQVREKIAASDLKEGLNYLRFTVPSGLGISAQIKSPKLEFQRQADGAMQSPRLERVVVEDPTYFQSIPAMETVQAYRLREVEMPVLPQGIINITSGAKAYQPSPQVAAQAEQIGFKLNIAQLNSQQKLSELQVYYFDYSTKSWQGVAIDSIDTNGEIAFVPNKGQTQYFGALIKSPEMPEASAFAPTMIQDIKPANPASGMNLMQPPSISQTGEASLSYPLEIPAGRKGMQPQLALSYNSEGGSSWAGYGWNIGVPSISVDTKWGVPEYDSQIQTESYVMNGEPLFEENEYNEQASSQGGRRANREVYNRSSGDVRFFERTRTGYKDLIRKGTGPDDYVWIEQDASGTRFFYGTYDGSTVAANAVLRKQKNAASDIAEWKLCKIIDVWGNYVEYHYARTDVSNAGSMEDGAQQIVLDYIDYTGHTSGSPTAKYKVEFNSSNNRPDASLMANYGFLVYDDFQLDDIKVYYGAQLIKSYDFAYLSNETTLYKNRLSGIKEYRSGTLFHGHDFEYYDPGIGFEETPEYVKHNVEIQALFPQISDELRGVEKTLVFNSPELPISKSTSFGINSKLSLGTGYAPLPQEQKPGKNMAFSANIGGGISKSYQRQGLRDMNGDGIPDLYEHTLSGDYYYPITINEEGNLVKGTQLKIDQEVFNKSYSTSFDYGFDFVGELSIPGIISINVNYGQNWNRSWSTTYQYLTDYNADGLPDLVRPVGDNDYIYFGTLDDMGNLQYTEHSDATLNPIVTGATPPADPDQEPIKDLQLVRPWIAPFTGTIDIDGSAALRGSNTGPVKVAIEYNKAFMGSGFQTVTAGSPVNMSFSSVSVQEGDTIFFRTSSGDNGYNDLLVWDPGITYTNHSSTKRDGAGTDFTETSAAGSFLLSGQQPVEIPSELDFKLTWPSISVATGLSDDVVFEVGIALMNRADGEYEYEWTYQYVLEAGTTNTITESMFTKANASYPNASFFNTYGSAEDMLSGISTDDYEAFLSFKVKSTSTVNWQSIDWRPKVEIDMESCLNGPPGNPVRYPVVDFGVYNRLVEHNPPAAFSVNSGSTYRIWPAIGTVNYSQFYSTEEFSAYTNYGVDNYKTVYLVQKIDGTLVAKCAIRFNVDQSYAVYALDDDGALLGTIASRLAYPSTGAYQFPGYVVDGKDVYLEVYSTDQSLAEYWSTLVPSYELVNLSKKSFSKLDDLYPSIYAQNRSLLADQMQHWGYFGWSEPDLTKFIHKADIKMPTMELATSVNYLSDTQPRKVEDVSELSSLFPDFDELLFVPVSPYRGEYGAGLRDYTRDYSPNTPYSLDRYSVLESHLGFFGKDGVQAPGKYLEPDLDLGPSQSPPSGTDIAYGIKQRSESYTKGINFGGGLGVPLDWTNLGTSYTNSRLASGSQYYGEPTRQLMDLNGDGYPDLWGGDASLEARVTNPLGGLQTSAITYTGGYKGQSVSSSGSVSVSSGSFLNQDMRFVKTEDESATSTLSLGGGFNTTSSETKISWKDINGDGLVDKVKDYGAANQKVSLNLGYSMASYAPMPSLVKDQQQQMSVNLSSGLQLIDKSGGSQNESFKFGINVNRILNYGKIEYLDVTKDGLPDKLIYSASGNIIGFELNTGSGFSVYSISPSPTLDEPMNESVSTGISASFAAPTISFTIPATSIKLNVNVEASPNVSFNSSQAAFMDMNGDGAPDFVVNNGSDELAVYYNKIGEGNRLKTVTNDLGGTFTIDYELVGNKVGYHEPKVKTHRSSDNQLVFWDMPMSKWVMKTVTVDDGLHAVVDAVDVDGVDVRVYEYLYDGGFKSRRERDFLGFSRLEVIQPRFEFGLPDGAYENASIPQGYKRVSIDANNDLEYIEQRFYSQVLLYEPFADPDFEGRKRYEYKHKVLKDEIHLLNFDISYKLENLLNSADTYIETDEYQKMISHKHNTIEYYLVDQVLDFNETETSSPVVWGEIGETNTLFPAIVNEQTVVRPIVDSVDVFTSASAPSTYFHQSSQFSAEYDNYFNITRYEKGEASTSTSVSTSVMDTIHHYYYETKSFDVLIEDLIDNSTTEFQTVTLTGLDIPNAMVFEVSYTADPAYLVDTIIIESYWDPAVPDCGGPMFTGEGREPSVTIDFKKPVHDMIFIEEDNYNVTYSADLIALMQYFDPQTGINTSDAVNVLKKHEIYEGATSNPVSRYSEVSALVSGKGVPSELKQKLAGGAEAVTNLTFDIYGNVTQFLGPLDANSQRADINLSYDSDVETYVVEVENQFNDKAYYDYDLKSGNLLRSIDLNGYPLHYVYDGLFRLTEVWAPREYYAHLENSASYATLTFEYDLDGYNPASNDPLKKVPVAITSRNVNAPASNYAGLTNPAVNPASAVPSLSSSALSNPMRTAIFVDGFGQVVQSRNERSGNSGTGNFQIEREVSGFSNINEMGWTRLSRWSFLEEASILPDFKELNLVELSGNKVHTGDPAKNQEIKYDLLGRVQYTNVFPGSGGKNIQTEFNYYQSTDAFGEGTDLMVAESKLIGVASIPDMYKQMFTDGRGFQVMQVGFKGAGYSSPEITVFDYNNLGELESSTNATGLSTTYTYDNFGRLTQENHPDRGLSKFTYDLAGNLLKTETPATGTTGITRTYFKNRLLTVEYPQTGNLNDVTYTYGAKGDGKNGAGRIVKIEQGNGFKEDQFKYDLLGNVVYERKLIQVPTAGDRKFTTHFSYDSWGRILDMTYPDGEEVSYSYDLCANLTAMDGTLPGMTSSYSILDTILYDGLGNREYIVYGNGTSTQLQIDNTRRLSNVQLESNSGQLLNKSFAYDIRGNAANIENTANNVTVNGNSLGGAYSFDNIEYDGLNQITGVDQNYQVQSGGTTTVVHDITQTMSYNSVGRLATKILTDNSGGISNYNFTYSYDTPNGKDHQITQVANSLGKGYQLDYNDVGSIIQRKEIGGSGTNQIEVFCWNEHQTLRGVKKGDNDHSDLAHYVYDDAGERVLKTIITGSLVNTNSQGQTVLSLESPTVYVNPYFIASHYEEAVLISKHYYMGDQRISSALSHLVDSAGFVPGLGYEGGNMSLATDAVIEDMQATMDCLYDVSVELDWEAMLAQPSLTDGVTLAVYCEDDLDPTICACEQSTFVAQEAGNIDCSEIAVMYWYHPDYLGSVEFITDMRGDAYQFFHNTIWGENLQNQMAFNYRSFSSRFRFNGKEWDDETGNFYYGARYYDPKISVWLSVDPLAEKYSSWSPYNFTMNNPINLKDPNGMWVEGAGFWDNLIHSDQYVLAKQLAAEHEGATMEKQKDGSYRVSWMTTETVRFIGGAQNQMNHIYFEEFKKGGNKERTDKTWLHTVDRQFGNWLKRNFSGTSTVGSTAESLDRNVAKPMAKLAGNLGAIGIPPLSMSNAAYTMSNGEDIFGIEKSGIFDRYIAPGVTLLAPATSLAEPEVKALLDVVPNSLDAYEAGTAIYQTGSEIKDNYSN